jgi:sterol desaturase/sphingolipid hydroxylase (fatty acid hydroxylase superfamily)
MDTILDLVHTIFDQFVNPKKRIFIFYLLASVFIALLWLIFNKKMSLKKSMEKIFNFKIFFSKSSKSDYKLFILNQFFISLISPILVTQLTIATFLFFYFHSISWLNPGMFLNTSGIIVGILFTSFHFLLDDFTKFFVHRCMHRWHILWELHKVHHSATTLTPMTVFRTHPFEVIIFSFRGAFTQAIIISSFVFLFGNNIDLITILGANIFVFFFNIFGSNLRHSHIGIKYWRWLEHIIISPAQHQVHHSISIKHHDKNFGVALALWDWLFGSLHHSVDTDTLILGIDKQSNDSTHQLKNLYFMPLLEIYKISKKKFFKIKNYFHNKNKLRRI